MIVPDLLGYGGTSTPLEPGMYCGNGLARDIVDVMDKEEVKKGVVIGHDWYVYAFPSLFYLCSRISG